LTVSDIVQNVMSYWLIIEYKSFWLILPSNSEVDAYHLVSRAYGFKYNVLDSRTWLTLCCCFSSKVM